MGAGSPATMLCSREQKERQKTKGPSLPPSLRGLLKIPTQQFCLHTTGQNIVTWPHQFQGKLENVLFIPRVKCPAKIWGSVAKEREPVFAMVLLDRVMDR